MAYTNGLRSPQNDSSFPNHGYATPIRPLAQQMSSSTSTTSAERAQLHRRFTTNALPTLPTLSSLASLGPLSPIGQQRRQAADPLSDLASATTAKLQLRREEYELLAAERNRYKNALELFDSQNDLQRLEKEILHLSLSGHQSEPTTPPEYRDSTSNGASTRLNRLSLASMASTPGIGSIASPRTARSGSQSVNTPFSAATSLLPSYSVPQSRRGSDEEEDSFSSLEFTTLNSRRANGLNRNSMPAMPSRPFDYSKMQSELSINDILNDNNHHVLLQGDDEDFRPHRHSLRMEMNPDDMPVLRSLKADSSLQPASNGSNDLTADDSKTNGWSNVHRHRAGQQSLPWNTLRSSQHEDLDGSIFENLSRQPSANNRRSMDAYSAILNTQSKRSSLHMGTNGFVSGGAPKLQSSYSTNDIPTLKTTGLHEQNTVTGANMTHAEQHLHNHNASLGRFPMSATSNRHSRDMSNVEPRHDDAAITHTSSALQANAPAFHGLPTTMAATATNSNVFTAPTTMPTAYAPATAYYNGYNVNMLMNGVSAMNMNGMSLNGLQNGMSLGNPQNGVNVAGPQNAWAGATYQHGNGGYNNFNNGFSRNHHQGGGDNQRSIMKARKTDEERLSQYNLESLVGHIFENCKDQHGCRFLQRKLEERKPDQIELIYNETNERICDLMTDPFGNYLCQKLFEYCNEEQRTQLIRNAAPNMVNIAFNQHGTRALQKMIESVITREQIDIIRQALSHDIVALIQDLNGNHVIQKCLNHLKSEDADFIFDEVGINCLAVGSHRHGCCVLQRCIDHAVSGQKSKLILAVIGNAYQLVQDPFGNYVVQYILDLNSPEFTKTLCQSFSGKLTELSRQKFSSNVIEKMVRCSPAELRASMCQEFLASPEELNRNIRDSYANYVVQTVIDHCPEQLVDYMWSMIRQVLTDPALKNTPAGRRIVTKMNQHDRPSSGIPGPNQGHVPTGRGSINPQTRQYGHAQSHNQMAHRANMPADNFYQPQPQYNIGWLPHGNGNSHFNGNPLGNGHGNGHGPGFI